MFTTTFTTVKIEKCNAMFNAIAADICCAEKMNVDNKIEITT
ncbi:MULTISPECIES: hypothetical protein [Vibrio]|uniref:Uncharacterized protein n=1 Tax=Vibrio fluvialis PG41 TaxID=1336752 RepID=S7HXX7_VIBFL|nr:MULTISPECIES: hypothetical protein [Vibrio]EPP20568.1 hypothetical protein L910_1874 [Vibrio fluvialis PG41]MDG3027622.1 hypothetical protein [Vibrio parahaemolyticus]MDG3414795.1 hypothetical protein [Vibrio parahaemolyticus]MDW1584479.1 hypothetical protein [Vibrio sp. Vb2897]MDW1642741.1 hypothetical protein [Vibrio sp. Vb2896]